MAEYIILDEFLSEEAKESADAQGHLHELVLCKDCIHFNADNIPEEGCGYCELLSRTYESEHYCADGERKDADNG